MEDLIDVLGIEYLIVTGLIIIIGVVLSVIISRRQKEKIAKKERIMPFCKNCGTEYQEGAKFCPSCGKPIGGQPTPPQQPQPVQQQPPVVQQPKKRKTSGLAIGCLVVICIIVLIAIMSSICNGQQPVAKQWFQGGDLHNATVAQWKSATYQNKLATAADWLAATKWKGHLNTPNDFDRIKIKAQMLVNALDEVAKAEGIDDTQINEIASGLITLSDDAGP